MSGYVKGIISIDEESPNEQGTKRIRAKLSFFLDKTINQTIHNLVKIVMFFRFLFDE